MHLKDCYEGEAPILWPPDGKNQFTETDLYGGKDWGQEEVGVTEHEMDMNLNKLWQRVEDREAWHARVHVVTKSWTGLSEWKAAATII